MSKRLSIHIPDRSTINRPRRLTSPDNRLINDDIPLIDPESMDLYKTCLNPVKLIRKDRGLIIYTYTVLKIDVQYTFMEKTRHIIDKGVLKIRLGTETDGQIEVIDEKTGNIYFTKHSSEFQNLDSALQSPSQVLPDKKFP